MKMNIYLIRDKVALSFVRSFDSNNDGTAVRFVVDVYGKQPHYEDLELWRFGYGYDSETGDPVPVEKCVVALPPQPKAPAVDEMLSKTTK